MMNQTWSCQGKRASGTKGSYYSDFFFILFKLCWTVFNLTDGYRYISYTPAKQTSDLSNTSKQIHTEEGTKEQQGLIQNMLYTSKQYFVEPIFKR